MPKVVSLPNRSPLPWTAQSILELAPGPIAVWSPDRSNCILNDAARELTGFTERDFREARTLWLGRIQPQDQESFSAFWNELERAEKRLTCDYRFLPKNRRKELRLRDSSASLRSPEGVIDTVVSVYTDISDLSCHENEIPNSAPAEQPLDLLRPFLHEVQNSLHVIRMGVDLMSMDPMTNIGRQSVTRGIDSLDHLCHELHEYCFPGELQTSRQALVDFKDVLNRAQVEFHHHGINCRLLTPCSSGVIQIQLADFLRAIKHIAQFCQAVLPPCGEVEIHTNYDTAAGRASITLALGNASFDMDEEKAFHPFARIHGRHVGLSMALARRILRRHGGDLVLRNEAGQSLVLAIRLNT